MVAILGPVASVATPTDRDRAAAVNSTRQVLLITIGGLIAVLGLAFTGRSFYLSRRGQLTDRYGKAIGHLASDKIAERLGGIYALEHLMRESVRDHDTVVEVLAAFIREQTQSDAKVTAADEASRFPASVDSRPRPATDIQAALTVLGRRPDRPEANRINLAGAHLQGADLTHARLQSADLRNADLQFAVLRHACLAGAYAYMALLDHANVYRANLEHATFRRARMRTADLCESRLVDADLAEANLSGADLTRADLRGADLSATTLSDTCLQDTRLEGANLSATPAIRPPRWVRRQWPRHVDQAAADRQQPRLTRAQLASAHTDDTTVLPPELC